MILIAIAVLILSALACGLFVFGSVVSFANDDHVTAVVTSLLALFCIAAATLSVVGLIQIAGAG